MLIMKTLLPSTTYPSSPPLYSPQGTNPFFHSNGSKRREGLKAKGRGASRASLPLPFAIDIPSGWPEGDDCNLKLHKALSFTIKVMKKIPTVH